MATALSMYPVHNQLATDASQPTFMQITATDPNAIILLHRRKHGEI